MYLQRCSMDIYNSFSYTLWNISLHIMKRKRGNSLTEVAPYNIMYEKKLIVFGS